MTPAAARLSGLFARLLFGAAAGAWMAPVLQRFLGGLALVLGLSLGMATIGLAPPYLTKLIIDDGLLAGDLNALFQWAGVSFAVGLAAVAGGAVSGLVHLRFSARMLAETRSRVFEAVLRGSPRKSGSDPASGSQDPGPIGEVMTRLDGDAGEIQQFAFDALLSGLGAVFRLAGGAAMLAVLEWRLALVAIALTPLELLFLAWARPRTERLAAKVRDRRGTLSSFLAESVAGLGVIRALGAEGTRLTALDASQATQITALMEQRRWRETTTAVPTLLGALSRTATLLLGGWWVIQGSWPLGSLVAFLAYLGFLTGPLRTLLGLYHAQARVKVAVGRVMELVGAEDAATGDAPPPPGPGILSLEAVTFSHAPDMPPLFAALSLTIPAGSKVLLAAPSGRGKSTLIGLLNRTLVPAGGRVTLDGADLSTLDPAATRRAVTVVPQVGWVFRGTIADNLRLAAPESTETDLWRVLDLVGLALWLRTERQGLETEARERGLDLSGGQRQRLALARALLTPFRVLILDESLSELDTPSAQAIIGAIDAAYPDRTRILAAHAGADLFGPFDQVIELDSVAPRRAARGETPNQRENARVKAV